MQNGVRYLVGAFAAALVLGVAPAASGDGSTTFLVTADCGGVYVESLDGTQSTCVAIPPGTHAVETALSAAADGSIVFTDESVFGTGPIWLVSASASPVELDSSPYDLYPSINYDGSKVVFARLDPATGSSDLYTVDADGSNLTLVASGGGINFLRVPAFSPDGGSIAYACAPPDNQLGLGGCGPLTDGSYRDSGIMRMNADGSDKRMIVIGGGAANQPIGPNTLSWSPDGQSIAIDGDNGTNQQVYTYRTDGSDLFNNADPTRQVTQETDPYGAWLPQFCGNGTQILYLKTVDDNGAEGNFTYLINSDGTGRQELTVRYGACVIPATGDAPPPLVDMTHITVPSVTDLNVPAATSTLSSINLTVGTVNHSYSVTVAKGVVVSQSPSAGVVAHRTQKKGPPVNLVVSSGVPPKSLNIVRSGAGSGRVSSSPSGIACGFTCSHGFAPGTSVVLTATPSVGSKFAGWWGACSGTGVCKVTMTVARSVTARFTLIPENLKVTRAGGGSGTVTSATPGISCGSTCSHAFAYGTQVTLTAKPSAGSKFVGWSGPCSGTGVCTVTMTGARSVTASFVLVRTLKVTKAGSGSGTVASTTPGISCGSTCSYAFVYGTNVTLTATPSAGSKFAGWSGACSGAGVCKVTMSAARSVTATFTKKR